MEPYAAQLLGDKRGNLINDVASQTVEAAAIALRLPKRLDGLVSRLEDGSLQVGNRRLERQMAGLILTARRAVAALIFGALLIAGAVLRTDDPGLGNVLMIGSAVPLLYGLWPGRRQP